MGDIRRVVVECEPGVQRGHDPAVGRRGDAVVGQGGQLQLDLLPGVEIDDVPRIQDDVAVVPSHVRGEKVRYAGLSRSFGHLGAPQRLRVPLPPGPARIGGVAGDDEVIGEHGMHLRVPGRGGGRARGQVYERRDRAKQQNAHP